MIAYLVYRGIDQPLIEACINYKDSVRVGGLSKLCIRRVQSGRHAPVRSDPWNQGYYKGEATGSDKCFYFILCLPQ